MARRKSLWSVTAAMDEPELASRTDRAGRHVDRVKTDTWHTTEFPALSSDRGAVRETSEQRAPKRAGNRGAAKARPQVRPPEALLPEARSPEARSPQPRARHGARPAIPAQLRATAEYPQRADEPEQTEQTEQTNEGPRSARRHGRRPIRYSGRRRRFTGAGSLLGGVATLALVLGATSLADAGRNEQANSPIGAQDAAGDTSLQPSSPQSSTNSSGTNPSTGQARAAPAPAAAAPASVVTDVATIVNRQLDLLGCGRVAVDPSLVKAARSRVDDLIKRSATAATAADPLGPAARAWASGYSGAQVVESVLIGNGTAAQAAQAAFPVPGATPAKPAAAVSPAADTSAAPDASSAPIVADDPAVNPAVDPSEAAQSAEDPVLGLPAAAPAASAAPPASRATAASAPPVRVVPTVPLRCGWSGVGVDQRVSPQRVSYWAIVLGQ
jgi:uncharacterized protein YkwD